MAHALEIIRAILVDGFAVIWVLVAWFWGAPTKGPLTRFFKENVCPFFTVFSLCQEWFMFVQGKDGFTHESNYLTLFHFADGSCESIDEQYFTFYEYRYFCMS